MSDIDKKSSTRIRNITTFSILIMLVFTWIVVDQVYNAAKIARDEAINNDARLLNVMSQQIELAFIGVDNALHRAVEHQYYNEHSGDNSPEYILNNMQALVNGSPRLSAMILVDESGTPVLAAHKRGYENWIDYDHYSFAGDELFLRLSKENNDRNYFIEKLHNPQKGKTDFVIMGHRLIHPDGSFAGAFIAAIDPGFFIKYFSTVEQGKQSYISLQIVDSGAVLVDRKIEGTYYSAINNLALAEYKEHPEKTPITSTYNADGMLQIYGFTKLKSLPVLLTITLDEQDYLKSWRGTRFKDFCFLGIFIVFGSLLSFFAIAMARQIIQVEKSEAAAVLASQAKSEFLANMSHELRTPLNAIIGFSEMMNSGYFGQLNPKQKERIHDINLCGSHLLNLITDILEFSKGDAGKLELIEERVVMQDIVNETLRIMNKKIKEKQMNMLVEIEDSMPDILGDKRKIRQVLLNLLSNSVKFTPENGTVKISIAQDANKNVTMTVSDTGIGIAEKDIPVALSVFGQVHRSQSHEGTGLGLPLCKMFAELHGGRLAFGSTLGEGTTVRITFPASRNL